MRAHEIKAVVEGQVVDGFISGNIKSSMITPADSFVLRMPYSLEVDRAMRRDAKLSIYADKVRIMRGIIDKRHHIVSKDVLEVSGRDLVGRLCQESAPAINYDGMTIVQAVTKLLSPWFGAPVLSNARNRRVRRGKGKRIASTTEPVVTINVRVPRRGRVHPGETRWQLIHEILSRAGLIGYSSSDGEEFIIGTPNQTQEPQYLFTITGEPSTVREIEITEDDGDRFSEYLCSGVGGQGDTNYGVGISDNRGVVFDNPFNRIDGTGRDFIHPKRMHLPERAFDAYGDAQRVAELEQARRDYHRHLVMVETSSWGENLGSPEPTLYATDTIARVVVAKRKLDDLYLIVEASYSFSHDDGDTCVMHMVPKGTKIVL